MRTGLATVAAGLLLTMAPAWGHHAFQAEFDNGKPVKLKGILPTWNGLIHASVHVDVKNADGTVTNSMVECGRSNVMLRRVSPSDRSKWHRDDDSGV